MQFNLKHFIHSKIMNKAKQVKIGANLWPAKIPEGTCPPLLPRTNAILKAGILLLVEHSRSGMLLFPWILSVCMYVCLSVCLSVSQTITFEGLDVGSSYLHMRYSFRQYGSSSYIKVIGSRSRLQEPKGRKFSFPQCKLSSAITPVL